MCDNTISSATKSREKSRAWYNVLERSMIISEDDRNPVHKMHDMPRQPTWQN